VAPASPGPPKIAIESLLKTYGTVTALQAVNLRVEESDIVCLLGPSGCGKTTLLNIIAGFEQATAGSVRVDGLRVDKPGPDRTVVFQTDALFPWLTSIANVMFGLSRRTPKTGEEAARLLSVLHLEGFERMFPYQLSGGMKQRVAIARALIRDPKVLLMDEPFGALDSQTRLEMQQLLQEVWMRFKPTIVFVTHDVDEAIMLGDRVLVMSNRPGRIVAEVDVPLDRPRRLHLLTDARFNKLKRRALDQLHPGSDTLESGSASGRSA
jgi:NitT/TauT family transport system ATP-binding protein